MNVKFDFNAKEFEKQIVKATAEAVAKKLRSVRCPDHGQAPTVTFKAKSVKDLSWEIKGCCEKVIELATKKLS